MYILSMLQSVCSQLSVSDFSASVFLEKSQRHVYTVHHISTAVFQVCADEACRNQSVDQMLFHTINFSYLIRSSIEHEQFYLH